MDIFFLISNSKNIIIEERMRAYNCWQEKKKVLTLIPEEQTTTKYEQTKELLYPLPAWLENLQGN